MEFRKMRRIKQQLTEKECIEILMHGQTGILGVVGDGGYPYTVPVNYVYENGKIFFHGAKTGHKQDAIKQCNKVSFCVIEKDDVIKEKLTTYFKSVILFGKARVLESDEDVFHAAEILGLKYNEDKKAVGAEIKREWRAISCIEIEIEHMAGKEAIELIRLKNS